MKIAVASQDGARIFPHAGKCRNFWIFEVEGGEMRGKKFLKLDKGQTFHDSSPHDRHPLDDVEVLIAGGMGPGLVRRLERKKISGIVTRETDPEQAVLHYLDGSLKVDESSCHDHDHGHDHHHGRH